MPSPALHDDIITDIAWLCSQPSRAALRASSRYLYTVVTPVLVRDISSTIVHTRAMLSLLHAMLRIPRQFDHIRSIVIRQNRGDSRYLPDLTAVLTEFVVHAARLEHISIPRFERSLQSSPQLRTALLLHPCITSLHFDFLGEHCLHLLRERSTSRTVTVDDADVSPLDLGAALATSQNTLRGLRISGMHNIFLVGDVVWSQVVRLVLLNMRISMPSLAHCFPNLKFLTIFPIEPSRALLGQQVTLAALAHLATNHMALPLLNITCPRLHIDVTVTENRGLRDREESSQMMTALNACSPLSVRVQGRAIPHPHWLRQIRTVSTMRLLDVDLQMTVEDADEDARVSLFLVRRNSAAR